MAKIRMLTGLATDRTSVAPGEVYECDDAEAKRFIAAGLAEPVTEKRKAISEAPEKR